MFGSQGLLEQMGLHVDLFRYFIVGSLIFTRLFIMSIFVPFLGGRPIPGRARMALIVALTFFFYPLVSAQTPQAMPTSNGVLFALFLKEALFGILLGFSITVVFYGIQAAGNMVDNQRQLANARIFNPALGSQASLFGVFFYQFAIVIFLILGGHRFFMEGVAKSFTSVPLLDFPTMAKGMDPILDLIIHLTADTLVIALQLSAPVLVAIFIADLILGLTNRVAPMINVFEMGFNIKGYLGVALVYLSLPLVYVQMRLWFKSSLDVFHRIIEFFVR